MPTVLMSVRLSPGLAAVLDQVAAHLERSPSQIVEALLRESETHRDKILKAPIAGPFSQKMNLRLSPEAVARLRTLTMPGGESTSRIEPSTFVRFMLAHFLSPEALRSAFPDAPELIAQVEKLAQQGEMIRTARPTKVLLGPVPGPPGGVLLLLAIVLLPLLVLGVMALLEWVNRRRTETPGKLAGGEDDSRERSPEAGTST